MIQLIAKATTPGTPQASLTLPLADRQKSRLRVTLDQGTAAGLLLPRGTRLQAGDQLLSADGYRVEIRAAAEALSLVSSPDPRQLARAAYHLGNRHVSLQILDAEVRYLQDGVLDALLQQLGFQVSHLQAPFDPEPGAYGGSAEQGRHQHQAHPSAHHQHD